MIKQSRNKKPLYALVTVVLIGVIGVTFAYFNQNFEMPNIFNTKQYSTQVTETFTSPTNWTPGTKTSKTVIAKNTGEVDVAVRVSYTETWVSKNNASLPLQKDGVTAAVIEFVNTSDWEKNGEYYYYKKKLAPNASTSTFINSVTFNKDIVSEANCTTEGTVQTCTSTGAGYDGATYTLNIKVETVQYDAYKDAWSTNVTIQ